MYKLTNKPNVICELSRNLQIPKDPLNRDYAEYLRWLEDGNTPEPADAPPPPTAEQIVAGYVAAVQSRLDDFAKTRGYDGILSAATYATSTVPKFASEGQHAVNVRDATWAKCYEVLGEVQTGDRPFPSLAELQAELPVLSWP